MRLIAQDPALLYYRSEMLGQHCLNIDKSLALALTVVPSGGRFFAIKAIWKRQNRTSPLPPFQKPVPRPVEARNILTCLRSCGTGY